MASANRRPLGARSKPPIAGGRFHRIKRMKCRHCAAPLQHTFLDLGFAPPSNAYLSVSQLSAPERYYPLRLKVCENCWLVQAESYSHAAELFSADYAYFSSTSSTWLAHAASYAGSIIRQLALN
ncbi:MAG: SAM-dependent methyltransferase, partial [Acidobacteria bacterium]